MVFARNAAQMQEIQKEFMLATQQLKICEQSLGMAATSRYKTHVTLRELEPLKEHTPLYRAVGRM